MGIESDKVPTILSTLKEVVNNKDVGKYTCLVTEYSNTTNTGSENKKGQSKITKKQIKPKKRNDHGNLSTS